MRGPDRAEQRIPMHTETVIALTVFPAAARRNARFAGRDSEFSPQIRRFFSPDS